MLLGSSLRFCLIDPLYLGPWLSHVSWHSWLGNPLLSQEEGSEFNCIILFPLVITLVISFPLLLGLGFTFLSIAKKGAWPICLRTCIEILSSFATCRWGTLLVTWSLLPSQVWIDHFRGFGLGPSLTCPQMTRISKIACSTSIIRSAKQV